MTITKINPGSVPHGAEMTARTRTPARNCPPLRLWNDHCSRFAGTALAKEVIQNTAMSEAQQCAFRFGSTAPVYGIARALLASNKEKFHRKRPQNVDARMQLPLLMSKRVKGVLDNFLGTFTSRYLDHNGYWVFGMLVGDLGELRIDLLRSIEGKFENIALGTVTNRVILSMFKQV